MTVVSGERRFAAPPARVFELLTDPEVIARALPGCRGYKVIDADHWEAKVKPPLPLFPAMTVRMEVIERQAPTHAGLHAHSRGIEITSRFDLTADGDETVMRWHTEVQVTGGGHGLDGIARHQADKTLDAVERAL
jgi:carbon monoxide dehydrogenase subunit G